MDKNPSITGIGSYAPDRVMTNEELEEMVDTSDEWIQKRTGIKERRIASEDQASSDLGEHAARRALEDAGVDVDELDLIIVATSTPDMLFPATACVLQDKIDADTIGSYDLGAGCSGFLYALSAAHGQMLSGVADKALVVGSEVTSRFNNWDDRSTCILFGDGAGAVVLENRPDNDNQGIRSMELHADGSLGDILMRPAGGSAMPIDEEVLEMGKQYTEMDGPALFKVAVRRMGEVAETVLEQADMTLDDIDWVVPHQANLRIIEAISQRLDFPDDQVVINVDKYANTSAASVGIALDDAYRDGRIQSGDNVLMVAFGAGLTWAGCVVTMP
jgi:3-oxoacyl-[acyl-carrier-protein] synthase-3